MSILGRLTMRNILGKPLRSFAIIIALAASAFAALFCIGGRGIPEQFIRETMLSLFGGSEIMVLDVNNDLSINTADLPENSRILYFANVQATVQTANGEYAVKLTGFDTELAKNMQLTESVYEPGEGIIVSEEFAKKAGITEGGKLTVAVEREETDEEGEPEVKTFELKITKISDDKYLKRNNTSIFLSLESAKKLGGYTGSGYSSAYIDVPDDTDVKKLSADLQKAYESKEYIISQILTEEMIEDANSQTMVFYLIFAVILLMTLFLTFSMSRHIANERLSTVGTLRSLGGSITKTSGLLMIESCVYGLIGGIIGAVLYMFVGRAAVGAMFLVETEWDMPFIIYLLCVLFVVVLQLVCQSGALVRAVKTPVRDIIFSSRDTAYILSIKKMILGAVLLIAGTAAGLIADDMLLGILALALICLGSVMVLPLIIKLSSKLLCKLFGALRLPFAKLAANEGSHKKSSVASTQLTFVALAITTAIFVTSNSIEQLYNTDFVNYDARILYLGAKTEAVDKLIDMPEITDHQYLMNVWSSCSIDGGKRRMINITAYEDFRLYTGVRGMKGEPAKGEAYIGEGFADTLGVKVGDTIEVTDWETLNIEEDGSTTPTKYKLKIMGTCNTVDHYSESLIVNRAWYIDTYGDYVDTVLINLRRPEDIDAVTAAVEKKYRDAQVETAEFVIEQFEADRASLMTVLYAITTIGCVLALLGAVSNAVIGFEQSKRKYAVLHSVAASKRKLAKLILLETLISSLTAGTLALILGLLLTEILKTTISGLGLGIEVIYDIPLTIAFIGLLTLLLLVAAVKPIMSLRKMNTAAELKYE